MTKRRGGPGSPRYFSNYQLALCLRRFGANERVLDRRQRIELSGLLAGILRLIRVALALIGLAQAIKIVRILLISLLQLADRFVVVFFFDRDHARELMS